MAEKIKRRCQKCGKRLSVYNLGKECHCHGVKEKNERRPEIFVACGSYTNDAPGEILARTLHDYYGAWPVT
jgi:hypothetical protein